MDISPKYSRVGHLFQGRNKAILIEEDTYLPPPRKFGVKDEVIRAGRIRANTARQAALYLSHR